jgi:hypothetical protein
VKGFDVTQEVCTCYLCFILSAVRKYWIAFSYVHSSLGSKYWKGSLERRTCNPVISCWKIFQTQRESIQQSMKSSPR